MGFHLTQIFFSGIEGNANSTTPASLQEPVLRIVAVGDGLHLDSKNLMTTFPISLTKYTYKHILSTDRTRLMLLVLSLQ